jgi:nucleoside-diphosphate-sugar epimerase
MKIFLTGATGYIGSHLAGRLLAEGNDVVGLARTEEAAFKLRSRGIRPLPGDMRDADRLTSAVQGADAVIHCAGIRGPEAANSDRFAVDALLKGLAGSGKPFIYTGAAFIYGDTGTGEAGEDTPLTDSAISAWRGAVERDVLGPTPQGTQGVVLRIPMVYGHASSFIPPRLIGLARAAGAAGYVGTGENWWSTVHIDDLVDLYVRVLTARVTGTVFNAAGPVVQWKRLAEAVSRAAGTEGRTVAWSVDDAAQVFGPYARGFAENQRLSSARAQRELGWVPSGISLIDDLEHGSYTVVRESVTTR